MRVEYKAIEDIAGAYVSKNAKRRCLVLRYVNDKFGWVCGAFGGMPAALKRAAELNALDGRST